MFISIPPKYAVAQVVGFIKGKSAIHIARTYGGRKKNFVGEHFWARGYYVSTAGKDEQAVRDYIKKQEKEEERLEQLSIFKEDWPPSGGSRYSIRFERFTISSLPLCGRL